MIKLDITPNLIYDVPEDQVNLILNCIQPRDLLKVVKTQVEKQILAKYFTGDNYKYYEKVVNGARVEAREYRSKTEWRVVDSVIIPAQDWSYLNRINTLLEELKDYE